MIAVDSSAILSVLFDEIDSDIFMIAMLSADTVVIAPTVVEIKTVIVVDGS